MKAVKILLAPRWMPVVLGKELCDEASLSISMEVKKITFFNSNIVVFIDNSSLE